MSAASRLPPGGALVGLGEAPMRSVAEAEV